VSAMVPACLADGGLLRFVGRDDILAPFTSSSPRGE
jgi:hypothetical protein